MLYKSIYFFFVGAVLTKFLSLDMASAIFLYLVLTLVFYIFTILNNRKVGIEHVFYFMSFILAVFLTMSNMKHLSYLNLQKSEILFTGKIVSLTKNIDNQKIILEVENISQKHNIKDDTENKQNNLPLNSNIYAEITTGMFQKVELYEMYKIEGSTSPIKTNNVSDVRPLFYFYETEKLNYDVNFRMGYGAKMQKIEYQKTFLEKIIKDIKDIVSYLKDILQKNLQEPYSSIATGVSLGDTNFFTKDIKQIFIDSGLIHLMVLSGTNVTIVIGAIWFIFRRFSIKMRLVFSLLFIWIFIFMTGFNPPAVRAGIMGSFLILGNVLGRKYNLWHSLVLSLFLISLYDINSLFYNPSLHLSFLATFALFMMSPIFYNLLNQYSSKLSAGGRQDGSEIKNKTEIKKHKYNFIRIFLSVSFSIFLTTTPYILGLAGKFGLAGILLTFICEPVTFIVMFFSFLIIFLQLILDFISYILNILHLNFISNFFTFIIEIFISIFSSITTFFANIFLEIATFGADYFGKFEVNISQNFLIIYYFILLSFFIFLYFRNLKISEVK